jgi:prephenate dehydrogenase
MKIAVIGGSGRMGRWFTQYFVSKGHEVIISDVKVEEASTFAEKVGVKFARNNAEAVKSADLIIVSTPIRVVPLVIKEITNFLRKGTIIAEISSLKTNVIDALESLAKLNVHPLSIHPLFGPGAEKLSERKIAVIPVVNSKTEIKLAKKIFPEGKIILVEAEEHDRVMSLILSLPHFINIVFGSIIVDECLASLKMLEGTTFKLQLALTNSVLMEEQTLQTSIQMDNKYVPKLLEKFTTNSKNLIKMIMEKEEEKFTSIYKSLRISLSQDPNFSKSYLKLYKILDSL